MAHSSKNTFEVINNDIYIYGDGWKRVGLTTFCESYYDELTSVTWSKGKHDYLYNSKFGYLHRYIMEKWYNKNTVEEFTSKGWVVDHINNDSMDCRISNLDFLLKRLNTAKGQKLDIDRERLLYRLALNICKDFYTGNYQLSLICNESMKIVNSCGREIIPAVIHLLYKCNYKIVISDAEKNFRLIR